MSKSKKTSSTKPAAFHSSEVLGHFKISGDTIRIEQEESGRFRIHATGGLFVDGRKREVFHTDPIRAFLIFRTAVAAAIDLEAADWL